MSARTSHPHAPRPVEPTTRWLLLLIALLALGLSACATSRVVPPEACVCEEIYAPVCGVDGSTYGNACLAACVGVAVDRPGECTGSCSCPAIHAPVCGVDGRTYGNSCLAACNSVGVAYSGECGVACDPVLCDLYCEFGFETDASGCPTCACATGTACGSDGECAGHEYCDMTTCSGFDARPACPPGSSCDPAPPAECAGVCRPVPCPDVDCPPCAAGYRVDDHACPTCECITSCYSDGDCAADEMCNFSTCGGETPPGDGGGGGAGAPIGIACEGVCEPRGCPDVLCDLYCEFGFETGADGCATCTCRRPCTSAAECGTGESCVADCGGAFPAPEPCLPDEPCDVPAPCLSFCTAG